MTRGVVALALAGAVAMSSALLPVGAGSQSVGSTTWVSTGLPSMFEGGTAREPAVSADGTTTAFTAAVATQTGRSTTGRSDVFVRDTSKVEGTQVEQVSLASDGTAAPTGSSSQPSISCDGRFVAFTSDASLDPDDRDGGAPDIYVRDRVTGTTELVSAGLPQDASGRVVPGSVTSPSISADGRYVTMVATPLEQTRIVPSQVYVYDRVEQVAKLVSRPSGGAGPGDGDSFAPAISADGEVVAFASTANLDATLDQGGPPPARVFVWRRSDDIVTPVSVSTTGGRPDGSCGPPAISQKGRLVAYACLADNLVAGDANRAGDVFVTDWAARSTVLASVGNGGQQGNGDSCQGTAPGRCDGRVSISGDGRFVAFASLATNLLEGPRPEGAGIGTAQVQPGAASDTNDAADVFVRDLDNRRTSRVSVDTSGNEIADGSSTDPSISYGGRRTAFVSTSGALTAGGCNRQACGPNVFVRDDGVVCFPCQTPECPPPVVVPTVRVNQDVVPQGRVVTAVGEGVPSAAPIDVALDSERVTVTSDASGAFEAALPVAHGSPLGPHVVRAMSGTRSAKTVTLVVRPSAEPPFPSVS